MLSQLSDHGISLVKGVPLDEENVVKVSQTYVSSTIIEIVWFQEMSILPPQTGLEILKGQKN